MDETNYSLEEIDREKIKTAIRVHAPIEITSYSLPRQMEMYIHKILSMFLSECHQEHMDQYLNFCLGELLSNSKKANTKRIYFRDKNLNLDDKEDYATGMKTFKEDTMANLGYYLTEQKKAGLYVKLVLQLKDEGIKIEIRNNSVLCQDEKERIQQKLENVKQYNNADDVYKNVLDQTEGAGLGIIIIVLMLQKIGLSKEDYKVYSTDTETITSIELPLNERITSEMVKFYDDFTENQKALPVINTSFNEIEYLFDQNQATKEKLISIIAKDVTLTALLLKNACAKKSGCADLNEAFDLIGIDNIKTLISNENPDIYIVKKSIDKANIWDHSYKVAYFAYNLAKNMEEDKNISPDEIYLIALLHDIECILIESSLNTNPAEFYAHYEQLGVSQDVINMINNNSWHSVGGSKLIRKWGLKEEFAKIIENYKKIEMAAEDIKKVASIIYLADIMHYYSENKIEFYQIDKSLLNSFGIENEIQLKHVIDEIKAII